jgi:hypothetical protein
MIVTVQLAAQQYEVDCNGHVSNTACGAWADHVEPAGATAVEQHPGIGAQERPGIG